VNDLYWICRARVNDMRNKPPGNIDFFMRKIIPIQNSDVGDGSTAGHDKGLGKGVTLKKIRISRRNFF